MGYFADKKHLRETQRALEAAQAENQLAKIRNNTMMLEMQREAAQRFLNTGYSHGGASTTETWAKKYDSESLSPKSDIELNRKILRERSRDLTNFNTSHVSINPRQNRSSAFLIIPPTPEKVTLSTIFYQADAVNAFSPYKSHILCIFTSFLRNFSIVSPGKILDN